MHRPDFRLYASGLTTIGWRPWRRMTISSPLPLTCSDVPSTSSISRAIALGITTATLPPIFFTVTVICLQVIFYYIGKTGGEEVTRTLHKSATAHFEIRP